MTAATQPSIEDVLLGGIPGIPQVRLHNPVLSCQVGEDFLRPFYVNLSVAPLWAEESSPNSGCPRVDYWNREILKVRCVSRSERRMTRQDDTANHRVPQFTRASFLMLQRHQITGVLRRDCIKRGNSPVDFVDKDLFERLNAHSP
jgi:hypothetical protein